MDVIKRWITDQLVEFLGFEEEVTIGLVINYLESVRAWEHGIEERGEGGTDRGMDRGREGGRRWEREGGMKGGRNEGRKEGRKVG